MVGTKLQTFCRKHQVYFMNLLLKIWEDDKFRVLPTELYVPWDPGIIKILLMDALAMPHVGNLSSLIDGVTAASAMEQTFNMSKCKILCSLVHLTTHLQYKQLDLGLQHHGSNNFALVLPWRRNNFSPRKCEHQNDLHRENQGSCNN